MHNIIEPVRPSRSWFDGIKPFGKDPSRTSRSVTAAAERPHSAGALEKGHENQFAKGDRYARRDVFDLAERFGVDLAKSLSLVAGASDRVTLSTHDEALLDDYVRRQIAQRAQLDPPAQPPVGRTEEGSGEDLS